MFLRCTDVGQLLLLLSEVCVNRVCCTAEQGALSSCVHLM
jgi:hypothetical protein